MKMVTSIDPFAEKNDEKKDNVNVVSSV